MPPTKPKRRLHAQEIEHVKREIRSMIRGVPPGATIPYAGASAPAGWLLCDGSAISRTEYADLFDAIGTTYGAGDGSTTFNVPDLRGRVPIGAGQGSGLTNRALNDKPGAEGHTLLTQQLPSHNHNVFHEHQTNTTSGGGAFRVEQIFATNLGNRSRSTSDTGGNEAHNNMQPGLALTMIIKT